MLFLKYCLALVFSPWVYLSEVRASYLKFQSLVTAWWFLHPCDRNIWVLFQKHSTVTAAKTLLAGNKPARS